MVNAEVGLDQDGDGFEGDTDTSDETDARYHETEVGYSQLDLDWDVDVPNTDIILEGSTSEGASHDVVHSDGLASDISSSNDMLLAARDKAAAVDYYQTVFHEKDSESEAEDVMSSKTALNSESEENFEPNRYFRNLLNREAVVSARPTRIRKKTNRYQA